MPGSYQRWPWLFILMPIVAGVWFSFRPLDWPPDWLDVSLAAVHVSGAIVGYIFIRRLENFVLQCGWTMLGVQIFVGLCDEFTHNQVWDTWLQTVLAVTGSLLLAVGVARSHETLQSEAERFRRREEQLRHEANHDKLTGLVNRSFFLDELAIRWRQAMPGDRSSIAILFIDLDGFKRINDEHGHLVGDELLQIVGRRLKAAVREEDIVARVGGDEFAALISGLESDETLDAVLERVHGRLTASAIINGVSVTPRASIGVSRGGNQQVRPKELLRAADDAMYAAKRAKLGRDPLAAAG